MIVALGALQARAEEHLRRRSGARGGIAVGAVEIRRRTAVRAAASSDEFAHEFVQRLVFGDALANPMVEVLHAFLVERMSFDAQEVRPFQCPEIRKLRTFEQLVNELRALLQPPT